MLYESFKRGCSDPQSECVQSSRQMPTACRHVRLRSLSWLAPALRHAALDQVRGADVGAVKNRIETEHRDQPRHIDSIVHIMAASHHPSVTLAYIRMTAT